MAYGICKCGGHVLRRLEAVYRGAARPDDGDGAQIVYVRQLAAHVEHERRVEYLQEAVRIGRVLHGDNADVLLLAPAEHLVYAAQALYAQRLALLVAEEAQLAVVLVPGEEGLAHAAQPLDEQPL